jgi:hypothetical protein
MTSTYPMGTLGSVASLFAAILYQSTLFPFSRRKNKIITKKLN